MCAHTRHARFGARARAHREARAGGGRAAAHAERGRGRVRGAPRRRLVELIGPLAPAAGGRARAAHAEGGRRGLGALPLVPEGGGVGAAEAAGAVLGGGGAGATRGGAEHRVARHARVLAALLLACTCHTRAMHVRGRASMRGARSSCASARQRTTAGRSSGRRRAGARRSPPAAATRCGSAPCGDVSGAPGARDWDGACGSSRYQRARRAAVHRARRGAGARALHGVVRAGSGISGAPLVAAAASEGPRGAPRGQVAERMGAGARLV